MYKLYSLNENFLDSIDNEEKAYFLGMMYSDGYINQKYNRIKITLQENDVNILYKLKNALNYNGPLYYNINKSKYNRKNQYTLSIVNKHLSNKLLKLGCFQNKSLTIQCPDYNIVPQHLYKHFVRGCWDGDGTIVIGKNFARHSYTSLACSTPFAPKMAEILSNFLERNVKYYLFSTKKNKIARINIAGLNNMEKFLDFIYLDSNIYLDRKYEKYLLFKEKLKKHKNKKRIKPPNSGRKTKIILSDKDIENILYQVKFNNAGTLILGKKYGVSRHRILKILRQHGINSIKEIRSKSKIVNNN